MTTTAVIQARMGSKRLPGKVLRELAGVPILERICRAVAQSGVEDVVVATSDSTADDPIAAFATRLGVAVTRGSESDVLSRFGRVLEEHPRTIEVVRVTADCPFVDGHVIDEVIDALRRETADFAANRLPPPFQRTYPVGLDVEVCTADALRMANKEATMPHQREHVMPFLYENPERFHVALLDLEEPLGEFRWTVDSPQDLAAAEALAEIVGAEPVPWRTVLDAATRHPWIGEINAASVQRSLRHHE
ncbi:cytidylyltransferase domain-containing protein [Microbacterium koreense]|uniref:Cytidylyltransferase domain-containing protein n=1 Tax=Microbacterium koreense TaxID=323761 RepID=A0ABW2ZTZ6_9MICO